jgi:two-component system sensor histidine kinase DegS
LITLQEEERRQLAADIHDNLAQALTGMGYKIQVCRELINRNPKLLAEQLDNLTGIVDDATRQSRELMSSLRPDLLDDIGLVAALRKFIENFSRDTNIKIRTYLPRHIQLPSEIKICLFRVVQEALSNVYKHADSKTAELRITNTKGLIRLIVSDEGKGFRNVSRPSGMAGMNKMGLLAMQERVEAVGGNLSIDSRPGYGCRLRVSIPIK